MVAFWYTKNERTAYISDLLKNTRKDHAGRYCILKTGLTEIGNDKGRAWIVTEGSEIKSFFLLILCNPYRSEASLAPRG